MVVDTVEKSGLKYEFNGDQNNSMPNTLNVSLLGVESEALMLATKQTCGISNGSACTSHEYSPSYVLTAMGLEASRISSAIRISWGATNGMDEIVEAVNYLLNTAKGLVF